MRALILTLALLATLKIWIQDTIYRAATEEALVSAYRARAADACARSTPARERRPGDAEAVDWTREAEPRVSVGNPAIPVHIWQFENELWNARFRQPYLVLAADRTSLSCTYDILADTAEVARS